MFQAWSLRERAWTGHREPRREDELKTAIAPTWAEIALVMGMSLTALKRELGRAERLVDDRVWRRAKRVG